MSERFTPKKWPEGTDLSENIKVPKSMEYLIIFTALMFICTLAFPIPHDIPCRIIRFVSFSLISIGSTILIIELFLHGFLYRRKP
jgi:hypothetical protein